ncbi:hypothetical protein MCAP1_000363 [Malassezia caprae]|uniref:Diacylglycerol O-acyltransferase n=1 Tax=Malassezia caprae TaxID=1381934 RepID=A0AAF0E3A1_9BASI|nr:hypothetical protein MCAP1_000363 [Malassezia caprae]
MAATEERRMRRRERAQSRPRTEARREYHAHYASPMLDDPYDTADEVYDTPNEIEASAPQLSRTPQALSASRVPTERRARADDPKQTPERRRRHRRHRGARSYSQHGSSHAPDPSHRVRSPGEVYKSPTSRTPRTGASAVSRRNTPERREVRRSRRASRGPPVAVVSSARTARLLAGDPATVADVRSLRTVDEGAGGDAADALQVAREQPRTNKDRQLARVPRNEVNTMKEGRVFTMNGMDNLALLMEDRSYHMACFSMYMFKSTLDYRTVRDFFEVLVQLYPKYRYVVDFQPYRARFRDKARRRQTQEEAERLHRERNEALKRGDLPPNYGPYTNYSRSVRAGSWMRPAAWRIDEDFHVSENIEVISCGGQGTDEQVFKIAGRFLARHFDYNKPVWEALLVQGLRTAEGARSALMIKIHHCFSDGQGMIQSYHAALMAMNKGMGIREVQQWVDIAKKKKKAEGSKPIKPGLLGTASHSFYTMRELYFRKRTSFVYRHSKQPRAAQRLYYHSDGVPMAGIKQIREAFSTPSTHFTLNDVAVAILARAMARAADRLSPVGSKNDRRAAIFVPISIRPEGNWDLFNYTTGALTWLKYPDLDGTSIEAHLQHVHREMLRLKSSYLPIIWYKTFYHWCRHRALYLPNYPVWRPIFYRAFSEYHVATNVPGPTEPVSFGKHEAFNYHVLPPSSPGKATMAIGMISYATHFSLAVSCDDVPEFQDVPRVLCEAFQEAAMTMVQAAQHRLDQRSATRT